MLCWGSMNEKFYTPKQVAEILQVHQYTVLKWIREGKLRALKFGRVYRTTESEINAFLGQTAHDSAMDVIRSSSAGQAGNVTLSQVTLPIPAHFPSYAASETREEVMESQPARQIPPPPAYSIPNIPKNFSETNDQVYSINLEA